MVGTVRPGVIGNAPTDSGQQTRQSVAADTARRSVPLISEPRNTFLPCPTVDSPGGLGRGSARPVSDGVRQAGALSLPERRVSLAPVPAQRACGPACRITLYGAIRLALVLRAGRPVPESRPSARATREASPRSRSLCRPTPEKGVGRFVFGNVVKSRTAVRARPFTRRVQAELVQSV